MLSKYTVISPYFFFFFKYIFPLEPKPPKIKCLNADFSFLLYLFIFKRIYLDIFG